jgi:hypothetical protein
MRILESPAAWLSWGVVLLAASRRVGPGHGPAPSIEQPPVLHRRIREIDLSNRGAHLDQSSDLGQTDPPPAFDYTVT